MAPCLVSGNSKEDVRHPSHTLSSRKGLISSATRLKEQEKAVPAKCLYTWQEVAEHNTRESAWLIVRGKVYDVTSKSS